MLVVVSILSFCMLGHFLGNAPSGMLPSFQLGLPVLDANGSNGSLELQRSVGSNLNLGAEAVWQEVAHGTTLLDLAFAMERAIPLANPNDCAAIKGDVEHLHRVVQGEGLDDVFSDVISALRVRSLQRRSSGL